MLNGTLARRYAQALFELAVELSALDRIDNDIQGIAGLINSNSELRYLLAHPNVDDESKKEILGKIFEDSISDTTRNFLYLLIDRRRHNLVGLIQREFQCLADKARNIIEAKVISATALTPDHQKKLEQAIADMTGKNVRMLVEVKSDLIGGAKLQIGDCVMDGSITTALYKMREELRRSSHQPQQEVGVS